MTEASWEGIRSIFPPEFQDALANNCPPRPGVFQTARAFRESPTFFSNASEKRIEDIDKQIKALQDERAKFADGETARAAVAEACATICAPVRRIPRDVLHEIAHHSLATYPSPSIKHTPMNLSHVSSAWRSVVLHSPHLWTDLYLRIETLRHHSLVRHVQSMTAWFRRAGSLPINLYLYLDCEIDPETTSAYDFRLLLKAIAPWTSRVARLGIGGQFWINLMTQFVDIEWDLSNLHTLEFLGQCASEEHLVSADIAVLEPLVPRITLFHKAIQIRTLIANQELTHYLSAFAILPWFMLSSVVLRERLSSQHDLWRLLSLCTRLKSASLHWIPEGSDLITQQPTRIDKLERLTLEHRLWDWSAVHRFFSAFVFVNLTHLEICVEEILADPEEDEVLPFGAIPSFPSLTTLRLDYGFPISVVINFLRNMPKLRTLLLRSTEAASDLDKLFEAMIINDTQRNFLPLLEDCSIEILDGPTLLDALMLSRLICSRSQDIPSNCAILRELSLSGHFNFLTDLHEEIARMSGMTKPTVTIRIGSFFDVERHSQQRVQHPHPRFAETEEYFMGYAHLVGHESWLIC
ncbi:hypothetical protein D9619_001305 [Psilocybe cf. subviscida]|uniref:F-box domain-containing protein n=1 Tax=Psilocybe cf. subviscida TaxID=2480587 RepID=A0A8H5F3J6_9AGAR|nr:hypothetical protein D9619_001305 [Psilocybe cf. subviscida]